MNWAPRGRSVVTSRTVHQVRISTENSLEGRRENPKLDQMTSKNHEIRITAPNNTMKLFPKDLPKNIKPSPPEK
jgi:hypothetical protein